MKKQKLEATVRIRFNPLVNQYLKNNFQSEPLDRLHDIYLKPKDLSIKEFHPRDIALRFRTKIEEKLSKLEFITILYKNNAYSHRNYLLKKGPFLEVKEIIEKMDIEKFIEIKTNSIVYHINEGLDVILENFNGKDEFFKFEASDEKQIENFLKRFKDIKRIAKNMAWAMAEK